MTRATTAMVFVLLATALIAVGGAQADPILVNGGFESTTNGIGQLGTITNVTGWTGGGFTFLYTPGSADTVGAPVQGNLPLELWGPGVGVNNGMPATSPAGGNFIATDPVFQLQPLTQTINGFTVGQTYRLGFWWAAAQQVGANFTGPTTESWQVTLGSQTQSTPTVNNPGKGFTGWMFQTMDFTATSTSELLTFLAGGGPSAAQPPFVLLDGVAISAVPEPTTLSLAASGLFGFGAVYFRRRAMMRGKTRRFRIPT